MYLVRIIFERRLGPGSQENYEFLGLLKNTHCQQVLRAKHLLTSVLVGFPVARVPKPPGPLTPIAGIWYLS